MKVVFFEWSDYDDFVAKKFNVTFPEGVELINENYNLEKAKGCEAISIKAFSNIPDADLQILFDAGCRMILLRVAGFNMLNVDLATQMGIKVYRVAAYSPESIAEYAVALILNLARRMNVQREQHKNLQSERNLNSMGFLLRGKTLGLHGYGKIARELANIMREGFGMKVMYFDPYFEGESKDQRLTDLSELYKQSQVVSIHVPLTKETENSVNKGLLETVGDNFMLINTSRGGIVNTSDIKELLNQGKVKYLGIDVWGSDDKFDSDLYRDNVFQSHHIAFFTEEAVHQMITQTLESLRGEPRPENVLPISYA